MPTPSDTRYLRTLALAWLWSRPASSESDEPIDLATLDQWRQGLLSAQQSARVKRRLANDPHLMRILEDLVIADDELQQWETGHEAPKPGRNARERLRQFAGKVGSRLLDPIWAGGLVAVTASLLIAVLLLPISTAPDVGRQLDDIYAMLDAPPAELSLPWGPRIAMRGGIRGGAGAEADDSRRLAQQAFQAGMVDGMDRVRARYPDLKITSTEALRSETPACPAGDRLCERWLDLARTTGTWAFAVYLQCHGSRLSEQTRALNLLPELQAAWRALPSGHALGDDVQAIEAGQDPCEAMEGILRAWGR